MAERTGAPAGPGADEQMGLAFHPTDRALAEERWLRFLARCITRVILDEQRTTGQRGQADQVAVPRLDASVSPPKAS